MDYKTMASAYRQYAQTRIASNASTSSSSKGLGSPSVKTTTPKQQEEKKPSIMERFIGAFSSSGGSINLDQKRPDPLRVYDMPNMKEIQDYNTRTSVTDSLYDAQGMINPAYTPQMRSETRPMTAEEIKKFAPVKELTEKGITVEQLSSMDAPMQKATLESLGITNAKFVSSSMQNMYPMSLQEFDQMTMDSVVRGTPRREMPPVPRPENVDPETGQPIQSMADVIANDVAQSVQPATPALEEQPRVDALSNQMLEVPEVPAVEEVATSGEGLMSRGPKTRAVIGGDNKAQRSIESDPSFNAREVQRKLNQLGGANIAVDGAFGPASRKALGKYQASIGIPASGIMDRATLEAFRQGKQAGTIEGMDFQLNTRAGRAIGAAEGLTYNPYILNKQPRLRDPDTGRYNKKHDSGLTIGIGFDLGKQNRQSLERKGISEALIKKLEKSGWLGTAPSNIVPASQNDAWRTAGHAAMVAKYNQQVRDGTLLTLLPAEIDELVEGEYNQKLDVVKNQYERAGFGDFEDLSEEAKIALATEAWHRGSIKGTSTATGTEVDRKTAMFTAAKNNDIRGITNHYFYNDRASKVLRALDIE